MDIYHIWCDLKEGVRDDDFLAAAEDYFAYLRAEGLVEGYRITRRKLGLGPPHLGDFHILVETRDMAQLDDAFHRTAARAEPAEGRHDAVSSLVTNTISALYRDVPVPEREGGRAGSEGGS